jgi:hypothetical protein
VCVKLRLASGQLGDPNRSPQLNSNKQTYEDRIEHNTNRILLPTACVKFRLASGQLGDPKRSPQLNSNNRLMASRRIARLGCRSRRNKGVMFSYAGMRAKLIAAHDASLPIKVKKEGIKSKCLVAIDVTNVSCSRTRACAQSSSRPTMHRSLVM